MAKNSTISKLDRAKKRVSQIKGFYRHVSLYLVVNIALFVLKDRLTVILVSKNAFGDPDFLKWIDWNVYGTPIIWGVFLGIHAIKVFVFSPMFGSKWEARQIEKFLREEEQQS